MLDMKRGVEKLKKMFLCIEIHLNDSFYNSIKPGAGFFGVRACLNVIVLVLVCTHFMGTNYSREGFHFEDHTDLLFLLLCL